MISERNKKIMIAIFIAGVIFVAFRAKQYLDDRRNHRHDTYGMIKGGEYEKCADLDMFGFKFSVMLGFMAMNLLFTVVLILSH
jgi:hypothetical protein